MMSTVLTLLESKFLFFFFSFNVYFNNTQVKCWARNTDGSVQKQKINLNMQGSFPSQREYKENARKVQ